MIFLQSLPPLWLHILAGYIMMHGVQEGVSSSMVMPCNSYFVLSKVAQMAANSGMIILAEVFSVFSVLSLPLP